MSLLKLYWLLYIIGLSQRSQAAYLRFYRSSLEDYKETELKKPLPLLQWIDYSKPTIFYAFGFDGSPEKSESIILTYIKRNDTNFILVNWEMEARNEKLQAVLAHALTATPNSILIGKELGVSLLLLSCSLDMSTVQLAGLSLGAHLVGYAGTLTRERGVVIARITGLEPSSYKYEGFERSKGLNNQSAAFVAIFHTNPGDYGTAESLGHVDVWFNCDHAVQPGCQEGDFNAFTDNSTCSHSKSQSYFEAAVTHPKLFIAQRAFSCDSWVKGDNSTSRCDSLYVNDKIDTNARGNFFLSTRAEKPYGKGRDGRRPSQ